MVRTVAVACAAVLLGCASVTIKKAEGEEEGLRFYRPWPYAWVTAGEGGGCTVQVVYLPRVDQEFVIQAKPGIGSVTFKPVLADGWNLTSLDGQADSKGAEVLSGFIAAGAGAFKQGFLAGPADEGIEVGLYVLEFGSRAAAPGSGTVTGLRHVWPESGKAMKCKQLAAPKKEKGDSAKP
jgi:hypothetical protein